MPITGATKKLGPSEWIGIWEKRHLISLAGASEGLSCLANIRWPYKSDSSQLKEFTKLPWFFVIFGDPRRLAKKKTRPFKVTIGWGNQMGTPLFRASCALNLICLKGKKTYRNDSERMVKDGEGFFMYLYMYKFMLPLFFEGHLSQIKAFSPRKTRVI